MIKRTHWTVSNSEQTTERALACCRGRYQRDLVRGAENVSGSTLHGKARNYSDLYQRSRSNLIARLRAAGIQVEIQTAAHGARILTLSS
jgi:hypothetical protein